MATLRLQLARRTLLDDVAELPLRRIAGVVCLIAATAILGLRIDYLRSLNRLEFTERTARFAIVKGLSDRLMNYAEQYGRPVFMWTGVRHVSPAESTLYENLRLDLLDPRVRYWYGDESYRVAWFDPKQTRKPDRSQIVIGNDWPVEAMVYARMRWWVNHPVPPRVRNAAPLVK